MRSLRLFSYIAAFRVLLATLCNSAFHPDEFFQSVEIAHDIVFGFGWKTWEWQPETAIRSPLHALVFVPGYSLVKILGLQRTGAIVRRDL